MATGRGAADRERYVLCAPRGCGFNDVLCQIWASHHYARASGRKLLVDTRFSGLADRLDFYLHPSGDLEHSLRVAVSDADYAMLNTLSCYPKAFEGRVDQLGHLFFLARSLLDLSARPGDPRMTTKIATAIDYLRRPASDVPTLRPLPLLRVYARRDVDLRCQEPRPESLVVHHTSGGGLDSLKALELLAFTSGIRDELAARVALLGDDYDAVHIRHTDYKTDYESLITEIRPELSGRNVLICSDNPKIVAYAEERLTRSTVMTLTAGEELSPDVAASRPAHYQWHLPLAERRRRNLSMLTDLIGLSRARRLFFGSVSRDDVDAVSGFSLLADALRLNPRLLAVAEKAVDDSGGVTPP